MIIQVFKKKQQPSKLIRMMLILPNKDHLTQIYSVTILILIQETLKVYKILLISLQNLHMPNHNDHDLSMLYLP